MPNPPLNPSRQEFTMPPLPDIRDVVILTLTLNPALDRVVHLPSLQVGGKNIATDVQVFLAGKGVNVARALSIQGIPAGTLGFIGQGELELFQSGLTRQGVAACFLPVQGLTRTNTKLIPADTGKDTEINEPGFRVAKADLEQLFSRLEDLLPGKKFLSLSGSLPPGVDASIYGECILLARHKGVPTLLDTSAPALLPAVQARPAILKLNQSEFEELTGKKFETLPAMADAMQSYCREGTGKVIITMGSRGAIIVDLSQRFYAIPPSVPVVNPIGAGDAATAVLLAGILSGHTLAEQLAWSVAAASASVMGGQPAGFDLQTARDLRERVVLKPL